MFLLSGNKGWYEADAPTFTDAKQAVFAQCTTVKLDSLE